MKFPHRKIRSCVLYILQICCFSAVVLIPLFHVSCRVTEEGIQILSGDYTAPELVSFKVETERSFSMLFSKPVRVSGVVVTPASNSSDGTGNPEMPVSPQSAAGGGTSIPVRVTYSENNRLVSYELSSRTDIGRKYILFEDVIDDSGNSLTLCVPFTGYNNRLARVILSEIQDGKASTSTLRYEFIELYALKAGNLAGLELYSVADGIDRAFILPPAEVDAGAYVTVHLRSDGSGCISETGTDLTLSTAPGSCDTARDVWIASDKPCLGNSADVILLENSYTGKIMDAMMYCKAEKNDWPNDDLRAAAAKVAACGVWPGGNEVAHVFRFDKKSTPRFFSRITISTLSAEAAAGTLPENSIPVSAADWIMTKPSAATPGRQNSSGQ